MSPFAVTKPEAEKIKVNDLITIIVRESKTVTSDSKLESKKDWKLDSALTKWICFNASQGIVPATFPDGTPAMALNWNNDYKGDGTYDRKDELTTRVTARVIDVKPNGNLVLEAKDEIRIDEEGYTISLVGECRGLDVTRRTPCSARRSPTASSTCSTRGPCAMRRAAGGCNAHWTCYGRF